MSISRRTGLTFLGPTILAIHALVTTDPRVQREALAEGEALLQAGSASHKHVQFRRDAIETCLKAGAWQEARRHADALEGYTRPEPLPWSDFFIARGRVLAALGEGRRDEHTRPELERLCVEARRLELLAALPALEEALARL